MRTRAAIIDALLGLLREGDLTPDGQRIAERAGISLRSVYVHFSSLEDLYLTAAERTSALVLSMLSPIDPADPRADRIKQLCGERARINEEIGPIRRAAALQEPSSPALAKVRAYCRSASRDQLDRVFAAELDRLDPGARARRLAAFDAVIGGESWDLLRSTHGLAPDDARLALIEAVGKLLADD